MVVVVKGEIRVNVVNVWFKFNCGVTGALQSLLFLGDGGALETFSLGVGSQSTPECPDWTLYFGVTRAYQLLLFWVTGVLRHLWKLLLSPHQGALGISTVFIY